MSDENEQDSNPQEDQSASEPQKVTEETKTVTEPAESGDDSSSESE